MASRISPGPTRKNGIVAVKHGNERLWLETYCQAKTGTGVNGVGRFYYSTNNFDRYGMSGSVAANQLQRLVLCPAQYHGQARSELLCAAGCSRCKPIKANACRWRPSDPLATDDRPVSRQGAVLGDALRKFSHRHQPQPEQDLSTPDAADFVSATNLVTGLNMSGPIYVAPQSTVVLYLSSPTDPCPPPPAPLSLNATGDATPRIVLDWSASSGATGYNVKRATPRGGPYACHRQRHDDELHRHQRDARRGLLLCRFRDECLWRE